MKTLKARLVTLTISAGMALAIMMVAPALTGAFSQQESMPAPQEACAMGDGSCCPYDDAVCGLNGQNRDDKEYVKGSCSGRVLE